MCIILERLRCKYSIYIFIVGFLYLHEKSTCQMGVTIISAYFLKFRLDTFISWSFLNVVKIIKRKVIFSCVNDQHASGILNNYFTLVYRWSSRRRLIFPRRYFKNGRKKGGNNMERSNINENAFDVRLSKRQNRCHCA